MPFNTRTYKTGPRRSRRRPDPGITPAQGAVVLYPDDIASAGTVSQIELNVSLTQPVDGNTLPDNLIQPTGQVSNAYFIDVNGDTHRGFVFVSYVTGQLIMRLAGTFPLGAGRLVLPGLDPAVRGTSGEWVGSLGVAVTVA